ncbi:GumC family protein [Calothrix sp. UHCC 0171]|uniref:GumC family protein n=1 Tax=Calothrix sp. UHCC 0171 TaxID=3110245 RepID=UPI002B1F7E68|nr:polysaccharide biosynthesis tyrosine autokinase [Calothrix sp. UHCC 0171]MEA5570615.1 polysaccharide biosynthesis tyrosine autokinase [Calothrix sp. UHCC 0171]
MGTHIPVKETSIQHLKNPHPSTREAFWVWKKPEPEEESPKSFSPALGVLRRQVALIAGVTVAITTTAAVLTANQDERYEGRVQIMVEPLKTTDSELLKLLSATLQQNINEITRQNNTTLDYNALMEILKSPKIINPVVDELKVKYPDINYDQLVGNDAGGKVASGREKTLIMTRIAKGKDESRVIEVRYRDTNPQKIEFILDKVSQAYRKYSSEQQQSSVRQGIKFVEQQIPKLEMRVNTLQGQLQAFQQRYNFYNPQLQGEQLLKRLDDTKVQRLDTERKYLESRSLYASLQNQLGMQQNAAIAASALSESPQYQQIRTRIGEIDAKIAQESVRFNEASPVIQSLREERRQLQPLLNQEARLALGNRAVQENISPEVVTYQNSVRRDLTKQLADANNQVQSLETSLQALVQTEFQINEQIKQYPVVSRQYANLQRDLQVASDTLTQLKSKQEALRVDAAQQEVPWEIIMPPTIPRNAKGNLIPVSPQPSRNIMLGGIAGLLLGTAAAFLLENKKNVFYEPDEVQRTAKLPVLGSIPFCRNIHIPVVNNVVMLESRDNREIESNVALKQRNDKNVVFAQAFCSLYNRFQSLSREASIRSIAVTSATVGEGRTTVAANLAQIAAEAGQKVLLVDANLRHPQLHSHFGMTNNEGLSEVLSQDLDINQAIQSSPNDENLFVLTAGKAKANPNKLFTSSNMENFVEKSQTKFDLIIYDTPNLLGRLDTNALANHTDGILLVVGLGKTARPNFKQAIEELKGRKVGILGMVTNNLES